MFRVYIEVEEAFYQNQDTEGLDYDQKLEMYCNYVRQVAKEIQAVYPGAEVESSNYYYNIVEAESPDKEIILCIVSGVFDSGEWRVNNA